jgi:hypothetical protein
MSRKTLVFHSALAPAAFRETVSRTIDQKQWTLFSLSGFRGERPLLGEIGEDTFRLRKRRYYRNDFARQFYGRFMPEQGGTRIEAYFDTPRVTRYFMRVWLAGAALIGTPIFIMTALDVFTDSHNMNGDLWVGLVVPPALIFWGIVLPIISRLFSRSEELFILQYVQATLAARLEDSSYSASHVPIA